MSAQTESSAEAAGPLGPGEFGDLVELVRVAEPALDAISWSAAELIISQVPAYGRSADSNIKTQVAHHCKMVFNALLVCLRDNRWARQNDFPATATNALNRVGQGVSLADFMRAFRLGQVTFWRALVRLTDEHDLNRDALLSVATLLMQVIEAGSSVAARAYLEAQQYRLADQDRVRRDLLEDLLVGRDPQIEPRQGMLLALGLAPDAALVVVAARVTSRNDEASVRDAHVALRRLGGISRGLIVPRHGEVVGVIPARGGAQPVVTHLRRVQESLRAHGIQLAIGVSTAREGWRQIVEAYREARVAQEAIGASAGVLGLESMTALDYLMSTQNETAQRLVDPRIRSFVKDELAGEGTFLKTLKAYVAADLNAKVAADQLHLHVNTVYYRLERISERTGQDLRRLPQVLNLMVAVRILQERVDRPDTRHQ
ncbi:PucR family transcriptional regulator [Flexivirga caeni]|uniref:PucR family transcriptional regulator n=1 Tax=Flexivirga caeni TaxID=2294115 RepID=A0A3M9MJV1_9MICO|nr:PucR family transcriptional regulator [Flexivirga caeni]RNI25143.1 PucR family transcriptional regulator [Flexivirga caeni]